MDLYTKKTQSLNGPKAVRNHQVDTDSEESYDSSVERYGVGFWGI